MAHPKAQGAAIAPDAGVARGAGQFARKSRASSATSELEATLALHLRASGVPEPVRQFRFDPVRKWRADFAWPWARVLVEVSGGTWSGGRHVRGAGYAADCEKQTLLAALEAERLSALDLARRVREMGARWQYTPDDLAWALEDAERNPAGWILCCEADEELAGKRAGMRLLA